MEKYESPKMKFETVTLFEKIANTCWAKKTLHYDLPDTDDDLIITLRPTINPSGTPNSGCGGLVIDNIQTELTHQTMPLPPIFSGQTSRCLASTQMPHITGS